MPLVSNSSHTLELLKQLDKSLMTSSNKGDQQAFNRALAMEQGMSSNNQATTPSQGTNGTLVKPEGGNNNQGLNSNLGSNQSNGSNSNSPTTSTPSSNQIAGANQGQAQGVLAKASFNATGNLSTTSNLQDFKLLNQQNVLMQQVLNMSKTISATQASALQPSIMISLGMLQKLYELIELRNRNSRNNSLSLAGSPQQAIQNADDLAASQQAQILSFVMLERFFKLFENGEKYNILSRFFKKGPLGENEHETDTDDEYGNSYADVDAETDYIKRPRRDKPGMSFHHSMLR